MRTEIKKKLIEINSQKQCPKHKTASPPIHNTKSIKISNTKGIKITKTNVKTQNYKHIQQINKKKNLNIKI